MSDDEANRWEIRWLCDPCAKRMGEAAGRAEEMTIRPETPSPCDVCGGMVFGEHYYVDLVRLRAQPTTPQIPDPPSDVQVSTPTRKTEPALAPPPTATESGFSPEIAFHGTVVRPGGFSDRSFAFSGHVRIAGLTLPKGLRVVRLGIRTGPRRVLGWWSEAEEIEDKGAMKDHLWQGEVSDKTWKEQTVLYGEGNMVLLMVENTTDRDMEFSGVWRLSRVDLSTGGETEDL